MSLIIPVDSTSVAVFTTLAKENEAYYRSLGAQTNERVDFAINFIIEKGIEGAYKVFLSNFDLNTVFTGGCRPEIKQECKMLFGCLNKDMNQPSLRARQKFVSEGHSDQVQISLFLHVIEIWCPGLVRDETLINAHIDASLLPSRGSCSFSSLLLDAQMIVKTFRKEYRETILRNLEEKGIIEVDAEKQEKQEELDTTGKVSEDVKADTIASSEDIDKHDIAFDCRVSFHAETLKYYSGIQDKLDGVSSQTAHIVNYIRQNCEEGCAVISDSDLQIKSFFTRGKRPEIKKETKILFGWLTGKELEFLLDRARQKFTHQCDANHYRYSLFLYIIELWRPHSSTAEALRDAYIPATRSAFTGIMSSALKSTQRAVYELRQDLQDCGKPDVSLVKITKFQKQNKIHKLPFHSHDCSGVLEQLRHIFMSKVEQMKLNISTEVTNVHKRKLQDGGNNGDDGSLDIPRPVVIPREEEESER